MTYDPFPFRLATVFLIGTTARTTIRMTDMRCFWPVPEQKMTTSTPGSITLGQIAGRLAVLDGALRNVEEVGGA